jgi:exodeoxyribonuclease-3
MKIATWNVNSVRARLPNVLAWLEATRPDVLLMQEIKVETEAFPSMEFQAAGYTVAAFGQKSYNGVAIASLHKIENIQENLPNFPDPQSRYLEATIQNIRIASLYAPNGNPLGTEKFDYKLEWMKKLKAHATKLLENEIPVILGGDYNVLPTALDVYDPSGWEEDALYHPKTRAAYREILSQGYTEIFRALHPTEKAFSFWDYQGGSWPKNHGLRLDFFLMSPEAADRAQACEIIAPERAKEKASDHVPVLTTYI